MTQQRPFGSILFEDVGERAGLERASEPDYFPDLNLDQVIEAITAGYDEYDLKPIFYERLKDTDTVHYRQQVLRDLETAPVADCVSAFAQAMHRMREQLTLADKLRHPYQQQRWFLDAAGIYCEAVGTFAQALGQTKLASRGLQGFREYLSTYLESPRFTELVAETKRLQKRLSELIYLVHIRGLRVRVRRFDQEADYSAEVLRTFDRFKQRQGQDYRITFADSKDMNGVEANILDLVARLFSDVFAELTAYCDQHRDYLDQTLKEFDREVQFYLAYLGYIEPLKVAGLGFCYPQIRRPGQGIFAQDTFDLALAAKLVPEKSTVVGNDFELSGSERIFLVSGPNQGGKTTFARTVGQLHHLASLGYPVPGRAAQLAVFDQVFTHFEREEVLADLSGKLEDDLVRLTEVFRRATSDSLLILNEIFTSTTLNDARFLGQKVVEKATELDLICVYVTFVDELASQAPAVVSMVSTMVPGSSVERTYKVVRRPADGRAYAVAIAEQYGLTYQRLKARLSP
ncbi:MAG: DNA mismatch repair protein MutS [Candidatus Dormiibacterota bacterium]